MGAPPSHYVPAGDYRLVATLGYAQAEIPIKIEAGLKTTPTVLLNAGVLWPEMVFKEGGDPVREYRGWDVFDKEPDDEGKYRKWMHQSASGDVRRFFLPARDYRLVATLGEVQQEVPFTIEAGAAARPVVNMHAGVVLPTARLAEGADPSTAYRYVNIYKDDAEGNRVKVTGQSASGSGFRFVIPAGKYTIVTSIDYAQAEQEFEVADGEVAKPDLILNAGIVYPSVLTEEGGAPQTDYRYVYIFSEPGPDGKRTEIARRSASGGDPRWVIPEGNYLLSASLNEAKGEMEFEVKRGEVIKPAVVVK